MATQEQFLSKRQRYQPISLPQSFSDEQMVKDWTLSAGDREAVKKYRKIFRLHLAIQICAVRLYGRFLNQVHDLSPQIVNYLGQQLDLPPSLEVQVPQREATYLEHRQNVLKHLPLFCHFKQRKNRRLIRWFFQSIFWGSGKDIRPSQIFFRETDKRGLQRFPGL